MPATGFVDVVGFVNAENTSAANDSAVSPVSPVATFVFLSADLLLGAAFFAAVFFWTVFLGVVFLATVFFAAVFFAAVFFAGVFFACAFFAGCFFAAVFFCSGLFVAMSDTLVDVLLPLAQDGVGYVHGRN